MYRAAKRAFALLPVFLLCACYSFSGGGFPQDVRTIFIAPLDNKTAKFELDTQLQRALTERLPRSLGVRFAGERVADAVLRGSITQYNDVAQNYRPGDNGNVTVIAHKVTISVAVQIIDVKHNRVLWDGTASGSGDYRPDSQTDEVARTKAIQQLIQAIVDGAQSQW